MEIVPGGVHHRHRGCPYAVAMAFGGFPADAFGFYERLEADNSRRFWDARKTEYPGHAASRWTIRAWSCSGTGR